MKEDSYSNSTLISSSLREANKFNTNYNKENMMSPKGYKDKNSTSPSKSDNNNNNDNNDNSHVSTPRNSLSNKDQTTNTDNYPMTPSPPNKIRRSSASMSFLATPKFNSLNNIEQQQLSHKKMHSHNSSDNEEDEEEDSNDAAVAFSPIAHNSTGNTRLLPPTTPKSRNMESAFLSPTPHITSPSVYKESNKPIREISNNLKARLNYAFVKLQNGWVDRTLPELENELDRQQILIQQRHNLQQLQQQSSPQRSIHLSPAHSISSSYTNHFAYGNGISTDGDNTGSFDNDAKFDYGDKAERSDSTNSARLAFMKALSSPVRSGNLSSSSTVNDSSMGRQPHPASLSMNFNSRDSTLSSTKTSNNNTNGSLSTSSSPLKWSNNRSSKAAMNSFQEQKRDIKQIKTIKKKDGSIEVAAIETLMSLSSPKKSNPSTSFSDKNNNSEQDTENDTEIDEEDDSETKTTKQLR